MWLKSCRDIEKMVYRALGLNDRKLVKKKNLKQNLKFKGNWSHFCNTAESQRDWKKHIEEEITSIHV